MRKFFFNVLSFTLLIGLISVGSAQAVTTNQINATAHAKHASTFKSIFKAIQTYDEERIATITTLNNAEKLSDDTLTAALASAWDPSSKADYANLAPDYLALANTSASARATATAAMSDVYLRQTQRDVSDRTAAYNAAVAAYAFEVKISISIGTKTFKERALALYKAQANANARALKLKGDASDAALATAGETYAAAAQAAINAFTAKLDHDESGSYFFSNSERAVASDNALTVYSAADKNAINNFSATLSASKSELYAALAALATSLPKLPSSPAQSLAAAYADANKPLK